MMGIDNANLTESQQQLLLRHFDGECNRLQRWYAERLLSRQASARSFVDQLTTMENVVEDWCQKRCEVRVDLWDRISARIEQEEYMALNVEPVVETEGFLSKFFEKMAWGFGGAFAAACLALVVVYSTSPNGEGGGADFLAGQSLVGISESESFASTIGSRSLPVDFSSKQPQTVPVANSESFAAPIGNSSGFNRHDPYNLELDWMRSDGRVKLIQDPLGRSAIIWVKRKDSPRAALGSPASEVGRNDNKIVVIPGRAQLNSPDSIFVNE
jgi:hypothetical protein